MTWYLVTFANENFYDRQKYLEKYAQSLGMGGYSYTHEWLKEQDFYEENKNILQDETGLGYFLWKSYIINDAINKMDDGDILFYTDVGDIFHSELIAKSICSSPLSNEERSFLYKFRWNRF